MGSWLGSGGLVSDDTGGNFRAVAAAVGEAFPEITHVRVPGQADLMFLREQGCLTATDLQTLLKPCRAAYEALAVTPNLSPHARFDILDWLPLDP